MHFYPLVCELDWHHLCLFSCSIWRPRVVAAPTLLLLTAPQVDNPQVVTITTYGTTSENKVNTSPANAAYIHQWIRSALIQIMVSLSALWLSKPMLGYCQLGPSVWTNFSEILIKIQNFSFIHENASENIACEMAAILSRGRWVNIMTTLSIQWYFTCFI